MKFSRQGMGDRIRLIRGNKTQAQFAKAIKAKGQNRVSKYESGTVPSPEMLMRIARIGNTTVDWILYGAEPCSCKQKDSAAA